MTVQAGQWRPDLPSAPAVPARPSLFAVVTCECGVRVAEVRDPGGSPVRLALGNDGRVRRDPAGVWWATKVDGQWRVVRPERGGQPPASGVRYAGHLCEVTALAYLAAVLGATPMADTALGWVRRTGQHRGGRASA